MEINWYNGIFTASILIQLGEHIAKHGTSRGDYNGYHYFGSVVFTLALLYLGGFYGGR